MIEIYFLSLAVMIALTAFGVKTESRKIQTKIDKLEERIVRDKNMVVAIENILKISDLWIPANVSDEHEHEARQSLINSIKEKT